MKNHFLVEGNEGNQNEQNEIKEDKCFLDTFLIPANCTIDDNSSELDVYACCTKRILLTISGVLIGALLLLLVWIR